MPDILHQITIAATSEAAYDAVTTRQGLASWWTKDVEAIPNENTVAIFGFDHHTILLRMRVDKLVSAKRVEWVCEGDVEEWKGTRLRFEILPAGEGEVVLKFMHAGWRSTDGAFPHCNTDWGRLMYYLKDAVEGRGQGPMMG